MNQEQNQNTIIEDKEGKIFDSLRDKELKVEEEVKFYGESASTEDIYEQSEIEQAVWQSLDGENCKL